jgi:hypothetical protein
LDSALTSDIIFIISISNSLSTYFRGLLPKGSSSGIACSRWAGHSQRPWYITLTHALLKQVVGRLFLHYDNLGCFVTDRSVAEEIDVMVKAAFIRANVTGKEFNSFTDSMSIKSTAFIGASYLGVQIGVLKGRCVWRHEPRRLARMRSLCLYVARSSGTNWCLYRHCATLARFWSFYER